MKKNLFHILQHTFGISEEDIHDAQKIITEHRGQIGEVLVQKKIISENQLLEALSIQYDIPFWPDLPLDNFGIDFADHLPIQFLKKYVMVPFRGDTPPPNLNKRSQQKDQQHVIGHVDHPCAIIAMNNPAHIQPLDDLVRILGLDDVKLVLSKKEAILSAINISYDLSRDSAEHLVQDME